MDLLAVADAIAVQFVGITANGQSLTIPPTARLPNTLAKGPALLVYHPTGELGWQMGRQLHDRWDFPVRLLVDPIDYPTRSVALYAWMTALRTRVEQKITLGLSYVWDAEAKGAVRLELDNTDLYDGRFDVVEMTVVVLIHEVIPSVSV